VGVKNIKIVRVIQSSLLVHAMTGIEKTGFELHGDTHKQTQMPQLSVPETRK
jgi:hypothetical protein